MAEYFISDETWHVTISKVVSEATDADTIIVSDDKKASTEKCVHLQGKRTLVIGLSGLEKTPKIKTRLTKQQKFDIVQDYQHDIPIEQILEKYSISTDYFQRLVKTVTGKAPLFSQKT